MPQRSLQQLATGDVNTDTCRHRHLLETCVDIPCLKIAYAAFRELMLPPNRHTWPSAPPHSHSPDSPTSHSATACTSPTSPAHAGDGDGGHHARSTIMVGSAWLASCRGHISDVDAGVCRVPVVYGTVHGASATRFDRCPSSSVASTSIQYR